MRKEIELTVAEKRTEALDAATLRFQIPADLQGEFTFKCGQFIGITSEINGEDVHRSYSLCSDPHEKSFMEISIKKVEGGKMSPYLVEGFKTPGTLRVTPPAGNFFKESDEPRHHVMFAAGSGVTPMISIIRFFMKKKTKDQISLFYWNKSLETTMFKDLVDELSVNNSTFNPFFGYTQDPTAEGDFKGRVSEDQLKDCFYKWSVSLLPPVFYLCGPEGFMETIEGFLGKKGFDSSQIRKESFNTGTPTIAPNTAEGGNDADRVFVGDLKQKVEHSNAACSAVIDGEKVSVTLEKGETLLEGLLREGENPPFSCMEGTCVACQCKVLEGCVEMPKDLFLTEEEMADGLILSCQALARSKTVKIDYDDC